MRLKARGRRVEARAVALCIVAVLLIVTVPSMPCFGGASPSSLDMDVGDVAFPMEPPVAVGELERSDGTRIRDPMVSVADPCAAVGRRPGMDARRDSGIAARPPATSGIVPMSPGAAEVPVRPTSSVLPHITVNKSVSPGEIYPRGSPNSPASATVTLNVTGAGDPIIGWEIKAPTDIVFVVDNTGSMTGEIEDVKEQIDDIVADIKLQIPDVRFGLAAYRDYPRYRAYGAEGCGYMGTYGEPNDFPFSMRLDLTTDPAALKTQVGRMYASGGLDPSESVSRAVHDTVQNFSWRGGLVEKVAILMGDYEGHDCANDYGRFGNFLSTGPDPLGLTMDGVVAYSAAMGVHWGTIGIDDASTMNEIQTDDLGTVGWAQWNYIAEETGGAYRVLGEESIADVIVDLVMTVVPTIMTAGQEVAVVEVVPPYIVPSSFDPPYATFDGRDTYTWDLGVVEINQTKTITFEIESTLIGYDLPADVYPDTRAEYLAWDGEDFTVGTVVPFPERTIDVLGLPVADAGGPYETLEGVPVLLDGCGSRGVGGSGLEFRWDFDSDGTFDTAYSWLPTASYVFGDDGVFSVVLEVRDNSTLMTQTDDATVTVRNVAPEVDPDVRVSAFGGLTLRVAGEKWHDVTARVYKNGREYAHASVVRTPGSPNDQAVAICDVTFDLMGDDAWSARVVYTPLDDPINGEVWGADPAWLIFRSEHGNESRLHHTFNVRHSETWTWDVPDLRALLVGIPLDFTARATDLGSDDLTFTWDWGDGTPATVTTYFNDGIGPDPYPSPGGTFPFTAADAQTHAYGSSGTHDVTLTVTDDDGGTSSLVIHVFIA